MSVCLCAFMFVRNVMKCRFACSGNGHIRSVWHIFARACAHFRFPECLFSSGSCESYNYKLSECSLRCVSVCVFVLFQIVMLSAKSSLRSYFVITGTFGRSARARRLPTQHTFRRHSGTCATSLRLFQFHCASPFGLHIALVPIAQRAARAECLIILQRYGAISKLYICRVKLSLLLLVPRPIPYSQRPATRCQSLPNDAHERRDQRDPRSENPTPNRHQHAHCARLCSAEKPFYLPFAITTFCHAVPLRHGRQRRRHAARRAVSRACHALA